VKKDLPALKPKEVITALEKAACKGYTSWNFARYYQASQSEYC
jgi:hypothetical protein